MRTQIFHVFIKSDRPSWQKILGYVYLAIFFCIFILISS